MGRGGEVAERGVSGTNWLLIIIKSWVLSQKGVQPVSISDKVHYKTATWGPTCSCDGCGVEVVVGDT